MQEEYVRRLASPDEVEDILDIPRLVEAARKKMEEDLSFGKLDLRKTTTRLDGRRVVGKMLRIAALRSVRDAWSWSRSPGYRRDALAQSPLYFCSCRPAARHLQRFAMSLGRAHCERVNACRGLLNRLI
jgi:hypothetical protein